MSACCAPRYRKVFSKRLARRDARRYRRKGLDQTAQEIVDRLTENGVSDATVLEVGALMVSSSVPAPPGRLARAWK